MDMYKYTIESPFRKAGISDWEDLVDLQLAKDLQMQVEQREKVKLELIELFKTTKFEERLTALEAKLQVLEEVVRPSNIRRINYESRSGDPRIEGLELL